MSTHLVSYSVTESVATIVLNDPPRNKCTHEMMKDLDAAILEARFDNEVHVILLMGQGEYFCGGVNIQMLSEVDPTYRYYFSLHATETLQRLERTPKLVVAALNGHAIGGGLELALACDLRIARKGVQLSMPDVAMGTMPTFGGTQRLTRVLGKTRALQFILEGDTLDAEQALHLGLVARVMDEPDNERFRAKVHEILQRFVPPSKAPLAVGRIKAAIHAATEMPLEEGSCLERELQAALLSTQDAAEGLHASMGKRNPRFQGR